MHIYVNGQKLGRLYTAAYHLAALPAGTTEVAVRLAGNDHVEYADVEGVAVVEVAPEDSSEATTAGPADHVIEAAFMGGEVETDLARHQVSVGDVVELHVTADATDEVHVHGYDVFGDVAPGSMAMLRFVADIPGIFEVELEGSGTLLFELEVR